ncbi:MAG: aromatic amino acid DMT transporter YddG [Candidatus Brocadiia bacterium]
MSAESRPTTRYTLLGVLAILFWSVTVGVARSLSEQLGTTTTASAVLLGGGVMGCAWLVVSGRWRSLRRTPRLYLFGCGGLFVAYMLFIYLAIGLAQTRRQAIGAGIINYLWPGLTLLFSVPLLGKKARLWVVPGALLAFAGAGLAGAQAEVFTWAAFLRDLASGSTPYLLALGAAVTWGLYSNLSRRWGEGTETGAVPVFLLVSGLLMLGVRFLFGEQQTWSLRTGLELAYMAVFPALLAYMFWDVAMRRGNVVLVAAFSYVTPVLSVAFSCVYLGVEPGVKLILACLLVVAGAVTCKLSVREPGEGQKETRRH